MEFGLNSKFKKNNLFQALVQNGVAKKVNVKAGNRHVIPVIQMTNATENPATYRLFQLMYEKVKEEKNTVFDPINKFSD